METDTIGLVVLVAALAAPLHLIAAKLSRCTKCPAGLAELPRFHFFNVESFIKRS
jgi:hypothetical protein